MNTQKYARTARVVTRREIPCNRDAGCSSRPSRHNHARVESTTGKVGRLNATRKHDLANITEGEERPDATTSQDDLGTMTNNGSSP